MTMRLLRYAVLDQINFQMSNLLMNFQLINATMEEIPIFSCNTVRQII